MIDHAFCMSSCLAFRYIADAECSWRNGWTPTFPRSEAGHQTPVRSAADITVALREHVEDALKRHPDCGLLLSSGIDSAILASLLPAGTRAYTLRFTGVPGAIDESIGAGFYAEKNRLNHRVIDVCWSEYVAHVDALMREKKAPLHPVEIPLYLAAAAAKRDGVGTLIVGNGADSTFGGLDKLLSRDWTFDEFVARYTFLTPNSVLAAPADVVRVFEPYRRASGIDVVGFLKRVHGLGIIQSFECAIGAAGCGIEAPYEALRLDGPLDMARIRAGESKYLLREVYNQRYDSAHVPEKIAFARPMDHWMRDWSGPTRPEFRPASTATLNGEQRWLVYGLERFLNLLDAEEP